MVKTRKGWYLVDIKTDEDDKRKKDEKEIQLEMRRAAMVKRCDAKIARRHLQAEQREICEKEKLLHAQKLIDLKQREIEVTNRLAAELSLRKSKDLRIIYYSHIKNYLFIKNCNCFFFLCILPSLLSSLILAILNKISSFANYRRRNKIKSRKILHAIIIGLCYERSSITSDREKS